MMSDSTANLVWARDGYHDEAVEHPAYLLSTNEDQDCALIKWSSTGVVETISKSCISLGLAPRHRSCVNYDERKGSRRASTKNRIVLNVDETTTKEEVDCNEEAAEMTNESLQHELVDCNNATETEGGRNTQIMPLPATSSPVEVEEEDTEINASLGVPAVITPLRGTSSSHATVDNCNKGGCLSYKSGSQYEYGIDAPLPVTSSQEVKKEVYDYDTDEEFVHSLKREEFTNNGTLKSIKILPCCSSSQPSSVKCTWSSVKESNKAESQSKRKQMSSNESKSDFSVAATYPSKRPKTNAISGYEERLRSGLKGFTYRKNSRLYHASIEHKRKRYYLGKYELASDASLAYDEAARILRRPEPVVNCGLNFVSRQEHIELRQFEMGMHGISVDLENSLAQVTSKMKELKAHSFEVYQHLHVKSELGLSSALTTSPLTSLTTAASVDGQRSGDNAKSTSLTTQCHLRRENMFAHANFDGTVNPSLLAKSLSSGRYAQPAGRIPKKMKWDAACGCWALVPKIQNLMHLQNERKKTTRGSVLQPTENGIMPIEAVTNWVQCEHQPCLKWRKLPSHVTIDTLPEHFTCRDNTWDKKSQSCEASDDQEDDVDDDYIALGRFNAGARVVMREKNKYWQATVLTQCREEIQIHFDGLSKEKSTWLPLSNVADVICNDDEDCSERIAELMPRKRKQKVTTTNRKHVSGKRICKVSSCRESTYQEDGDAGICRQHFNDISILHKCNGNETITTNQGGQKNEESKAPLQQGYRFYYVWWFIILCTVAYIVSLCRESEGPMRKHWINMSSAP